MGLRSLLLFWFQSRWRTTAVLVLAACSVPVPRQRCESDRTRGELRFHVKRLGNRVRPRAGEGKSGKGCMTAYVNCIVRK